jgi:hypothetical protein
MGYKESGASRSRHLPRGPLRLFRAQTGARSATQSRRRTFKSPEGSLRGVGPMRSVLCRIWVQKTTVCLRPRPLPPRPTDPARKRGIERKVLSHGYVVTNMTAVERRDEAQVSNSRAEARDPTAEPRASDEGRDDANADAPAYAVCCRRCRQRRTPPIRPVPSSSMDAGSGTGEPLVGVASALKNSARIAVGSPPLSTAI